MPHPSIQDPSTFFRGGSNTLKPNHITRYQYPHPLDLGISALHLQMPALSKSRSRPQGHGDFGLDGATFLTISRAYRNPPTEADFQAWSSKEVKADARSGNPLGRAMTRMSKYVGNTLLKSGKFKTREGMVYVIHRMTLVLLSVGGGGGAEEKMGKEEGRYTIPCEKWRGLKVQSTPGHDSWWQRLHDLYQGGYDRAFWSARDCMDRFNIPAPLPEWLPRPDVEKAVRVHRKEPSKTGKWQGTCCSVCSRDWYIDSEYACELKCGHWLCLECVTEIVDEAGRGNFTDGEKDPEKKYWRCTECRDINPVLKDRADIIKPDELPYWRYKIANHRLVHELTDWLWRMAQAEADGWCSALPPHLDNERANPADIKTARKIRVHMPDAIQVMEALPLYVAGLLNWGYSLDNPINTKEGDALKSCLVAELHRLASSQRKFHSLELEEHMAKVGETAFVPCVIAAPDQRLGNSIFPPGYLAYREFLCKWTALGCFLSPSGRAEVVDFMRRMARNRKRAWWKDVKEVFFSRGAPVQ